MKGFDVLAVCLALTLAGTSSACGQASKTHAGGRGDSNPAVAQVREAAVAGAFYPADPNELRAMIEGFLATAQIPLLDGVVRVLVAPHAGYVYSGAVAAHAFKAIEGKSYRTVVLLGNSHHAAYHAAAVYPRGVFRTPLGDVPIDENMVQRLLEADSKFEIRPDIHIPEHSLEVELPFLQRVLGEFKLVPVLLGARDNDLAESVGRALAKVADASTLVVVSTDLSHYPGYDDARFADLKTLEAMVTCNASEMDRTIRQLEQTRIPNMATLMCGEGAAKAGLVYADAVGAKRGVLLKYANSGDSRYGKKEGVVGYGAVAFVSENVSEQAEPATPTDASASESGLDEAARAELLRLARLTVETFVRTGRKPAYTNALSALEKPMGAFVTLKKRGQLRGCIGRFEPTQPLYEVVMDMAVAAATQDHRFPPVRENELAELEYEVSVLSPLRRVRSWRDIRYGRHGVQVSRGWHRGVFLPQVAEETGWDFETFMDNLCAHKAGLPPRAWQDPETELYVFTADVVAEHESSK